MTREDWYVLQTRFPTAWELLEEYGGIQADDDEAWGRLVQRAHELEHEYQRALLMVMDAIELAAKRKEGKANEL